MRLLPEERVLWQGRPCWRGLALRMCHVRGVGLYVGVVVAGTAAVAALEGSGPVEVVLTAGPMLAAGALVLAFLGGLAWLVARTTDYMVTTHRLVLRYGIALPATLAIPHSAIARLSVAVHGDQTGDLPLALKPGFHLAWHRLWPHCRPWHLRRPQPMLRSIPEAGRVATLLAGALATMENTRRQAPPPPAPAATRDPLGAQAPA